MKTTIIFVRHGETLHNSKKIICGHTDSTLSKKGKEQAKKVGLRFKDESIDVLFSSDSARAKQTAAEIKKHHAISLGYDARLRERNYGTYEGKHLNDWLKALSKTKTPFHKFKPRRGESPEEVINRSLDFIDEMLRTHPGKSILLVAHGTIIRQTVMALLKKKDATHKKYHHMNTGVTIIEFKGKTPKLKLLNCTKHLK